MKYSVGCCGGEGETDYPTAYMLELDINLFPPRSRGTTEAAKEQVYSPSRDERFSYAHMLYLDCMVSVTGGRTDHPRSSSPNRESSPQDLSSEHP